MKPAHSVVTGFANFVVSQVPRSENYMANALATLAPSEIYPCHVELNIMAHPSIKIAPRCPRLPYI